MIEKELLAVVLALEKFHPYLLGFKTVIFMDHSVLKHLMTKKEAKAWLIHWILLLQEFDLEIHDKKGVKNVVADYLSIFPNALVERTPINEVSEMSISSPFWKNPGMRILSIIWSPDNYLLNGQNRTGIDSLPRFDTFFGKNRISSSTVLTRLFGDVY